MYANKMVFIINLLKGYSYCSSKLHAAEIKSDLHCSGGLLRGELLRSRDHVTVIIQHGLASLLIIELPLYRISRVRDQVLVGHGIRNCDIFISHGSLCPVLGIFGLCANLRYINALLT